MSTKNKPGLFISIEGPDCVGKSTIIDKLKDAIDANFLKETHFNDVVFSHEPGGCSLAKILREIILNSTAIALDTNTTTRLFILSRVYHLKQTILPALKNNDLVIVDRYVDSTAIYQGYLQHQPVTKIYELNNRATNNLMPDLTFYLRANIETIKQRSLNRGSDKFDEVYLTKIDKIIQGFDVLAQMFPNRFVILDATKTPTEITLEIMNTIKAYVH